MSYLNPNSENIGNNAADTENSSSIHGGYKEGHNDQLIDLTCKAPSKEHFFL